MLELMDLPIKKALEGSHSGIKKNVPFIHADSKFTNKTYMALSFNEPKPNQHLGSMRQNQNHMLQMASNVIIIVFEWCFQAPCWACIGILFLLIC